MMTQERRQRLVDYANDLWSEQRVAIEEYVEVALGGEQYVNDLLELAAEQDESVGISGITDPEEVAVLREVFMGLAGRYLEE